MARSRDGRDFEALLDDAEEARTIRFNRAIKYERRWAKRMRGARFQNEDRPHDWRFDYAGQRQSGSFGLVPA